MTAPVSPILFVAGLGRCGTSMMMQMLAAGGMPVTGDTPAYEDRRAGFPRDWTWVLGQRGTAVKLLDPHIAAPPPAGAWNAPASAIPAAESGEAAACPPWVTIWLDRAFEEQARSQLKLLRTFGEIPDDRGPARRQVRHWAHQLRQDRASGLSRMRRQPLLQLRFETILADPAAAAARVADWLCPWFPALDPVAMAMAVIPRPSACAAGMELEAQLLAFREGDGRRDEGAAA